MPPQAAAAPEGPSGATKAIDGSAFVPTLAVQWMGGHVEEHDFSRSILAVGRAPDNDLVINHPAVSGHHLRLEKSAAEVSVTDLQSTNGTQVNGRRIAPNSKFSIQAGDVIRIGDLTGNWVGIRLEGAGGKSIRIRSLDSLDLTPLTNITIGRDPASNLHLDHPTVSFHHALITKQNGAMQIRDLSSTNGTFVNDARIQQSPLKSGDTVQIGPYKLVYNAQQQNLAPSMSMGHRLDAVNLSREVTKRRSGMQDVFKRRGKIKILNDISLSIQPGDFVALVGGSGAGKSTLMKAMNGFEPANLGQMLLDGEPLYSRIDMYRNQMGYVPQDDIIHRELPVRTALWYSARLRLPDAKSDEIDQRIMEALRAVDMVEHADKPVRVLSGGQRKRVSIAVELLAKPTLFFLDEPTSGLDPGLEKKMMYDLNRLADEGRTVVLVTHATANIEQCNYVSFLSWGKMAYFGPPDDALRFFNVQDFADIYLRLSEDYDPSKGKQAPPELQPYIQGHAGHNGSSIRSGDLWADHFRQSAIYQQHVANRQTNLAAGGSAGSMAAAPPKRARDNALRQTWILARRMFDLIRNDVRTMIILLLMMPFIAGLFALVSSERDLVDGLQITTGNVYSESVTDEGRDGSLYVMTKDSIEEELKAQLDGDPVDAELSHTPYQDAKMLLVMIGLAMTQGGAFAAAYEIVKEQAIFKRERAVNLKVSAYVFSKLLVLALFALVQVALVVLILGLAIDLGYETLILPEGYQEIYVTLYLAVLASICFGLFISAAVPNTDIVLYIILAQLFVQIILSGALFPLPSNPASYATPGYWAMNSLSSQVNLANLNELGTSCKVVEIPPVPGQSDQASSDVQCAAARAPVSEDDFLDSLDYTEEHILITWGALGAHTILWTILTVIVLARKKIE
jgi:ABC-type multidrug transport system ATPase subunit/pSer/pThr/pTyr-binding forkhead associated (FHA) protein